MKEGNLVKQIRRKKIADQICKKKMQQKGKDKGNGEERDVEREDNYKKVTQNQGHKINEKSKIRVTESESWF